MAINWTDELSTGVLLIDRQHQEIFKRYNTYLDACKKGAGRNDLAELIDFLVKYVADHFSHEEQVMKQYKYPDLDTHIEEHKKLTNMVHGFKDRLATDGPSLGAMVEVNRSLLDWLVDHIKKSDLELGSFLNQKWGMF